MTPTTTEPVLERIRKLQRLSRSGNEHEAALAASKMQELLFKHNLSIETLSEPSEYVEEKRELGSRVWARRLMVGLCRNNFCEPLRAAWGGEIFIVGRRENVTAVNEMFVYLVGEINRLAKGSYKDYKVGTPWPENANSWCSAFRSGAVATINGRLRAQRELDVAKIATTVVGDETGTAIIRRLDIELKAEVSRRHPRLGTRRDQGSAIRSRSGFQAGQAAGGRIALNRPSGGHLS